MTNNSSSSTVVALAAGSALVVASLGYAMYGQNGRTRNHAGTTRGGMNRIPSDDNSSIGDDITATEVCQILDDLHAQTQDALQTFLQQAQQVQEARTPLRLSQLRASLERTLAATQRRLLERVDIDPDCWEDAVWDFLEQPDKYPHVTAAVERLQTLWERCNYSSYVVPPIPYASSSAVAEFQKKAAITKDGSHFFPASTALS